MSADAKGTTSHAFDVSGLAAALAPFDPDRRRIAGEAWADAGLAEHASVASFARFVQELMALAAPPDLLEDALRSARDEVAHARDSFAIASVFLGEPVGPGPLPAMPPRVLDLAGLARTTFHEACIDETLGAMAAEEAAHACTLEPVRDVLATIATEEARHAQLAWKTLGWALAVGGAPVAAALRDLRDALPRGVDSPVVPDDVRAWLAFGVVPDAWFALHRPWVEATLVGPLLDDLLEGTAAGSRPERSSPPQRA